ncbi:MULTISPECIES: small secreted protein [unclassified Streptomyces]|uniref:small secreted protein n=1 Tax=unclassified Streptomyces TaxID=2593676 RepID=UPI001BEA6E11|nr:MULTISPECIES: small secreted protein [unclassified Streptomyces]MBT2402220.1 small secreted protein [Streptomyces sp. ISL-21]MBT2609406.1 small secreted protein [Streptomyces sp. ISL-87]
MNKKFAAAVSGGAVLMLVLSGCGEDDSDKKAEAWAKKVCDAWQPELKKIETADADIKRVSTESSKPEEVQKTDSEAFQTKSDSYKALAGALQGAGVPPVKDGQATQDAAVKGFQDTSKGYADLKAKVDALDPKDQLKFADGLKAVANGLAEASKGGQDALDKLKTGGLDKVMNNQKGCQVTVPSPPK